MVLNENEKRAMRAICDDCDDIDGYGFTRMGDMAYALLSEFGNSHVAGGYMSDLDEKGLIDICYDDNEVWVSPNVFAEYRGY